MCCVLNLHARVKRVARTGTLNRRAKFSNTTKRVLLSNVLDTGLSVRVDEFLCVVPVNLMTPLFGAQTFLRLKICQRFDTPNTLNVLRIQSILSKISLWEIYCTYFSNTEYPERTAFFDRFPNFTVRNLLNTNDIRYSHCEKIHKMPQNTEPRMLCFFTLWLFLYEKKKNGRHTEHLFCCV